MTHLSVAHFYQDGGLRFSRPQAAQLHIYQTIRGLQQAGHTVKLVALQGRDVICTQELRVFSSDQLSVSNFAQLGLSGTKPFKLVESAVRRVQSETRFPYLALFDSFRLAEAGRMNLKDIDLIHERFNLLALGGAWASRKLNVPLVLEVNADLLEQRKYKGNPERGLRHLYAVWSTQLCFQAAAGIICISEGLRDHLRTRWKLDPSKLAVLPCAADIEAFGQTYNIAQIRRRFSLTSEPVVMWVGGFYPWHDLDLLLESFRQVLRSQPRAKLLLVGDGQTRPAVSHQVKITGLESAVMMTGAIPHAAVPELLSIADVAVVPAVSVAAGYGGTGTPLKLFEYMAAGKAIVATGINQASDVISDGQNGRLIRAGDAQAFAEAIVDLLKNPEERLRLGQNARREAVERYSWEAYTRQLESAYLRILNKMPLARTLA